MSATVTVPARNSVLDSERIKTSVRDSGAQKPREFAKALEWVYALLPTEHERTKVIKRWNGLQVEIQIRLTELGFNPEVDSWKTIVDQADKVYAALFASELRADTVLTRPKVHVTGNIEKKFDVLNGGIQSVTCMNFWSG